jgi:hypothetical protein
MRADGQVLTILAGLAILLLLGLLLLATGD